MSHQHWDENINDHYTLYMVSTAFPRRIKQWNKNFQKLNWIKDFYYKKLLRQRTTVLAGRCGWDCSCRASARAVSHTANQSVTPREEPGCHFWGTGTRDSIQVRAGPRWGTSVTFPMRKCSEPCLEHPHGLCQALGLFPLLHPWAHPQGTVVARMWYLTQQEGDQECMGTSQNACKTAKRGLIKYKSIL